VGSDLLETRPPPRDLLLDKGLNGKAFPAGQADRSTACSSRPPRTAPPHATDPAEIIAE
jgi:hypothetical protein